MEMIEYNVLKAVDNNMTTDEIHAVLVDIAKQYDVRAFSFRIEWSSWKSDNYKLHKCFQFGMSAKESLDEKRKWGKIAIEVNKRFSGAKAILFMANSQVEPIFEGAHNDAGKQAIMEEMEIKVKVDASEVDTAIEKLNQLNTMHPIPHKCPICNGEGMTNPWVTTTSTAKEICNACHGTGIIWG